MAFVAELKQASTEWGDNVLERQMLLQGSFALSLV
jgi:hypothetical protein